MTVQHLCGGRWKEGKLTACPDHAKLRKRRRVWGPKERAKMDKSAGVVGVDRGGFISGR